MSSDTPTPASVSSSAASAPASTDDAMSGVAET